MFSFNDLELALALNPNNYNAMFGVAVMKQEFGNLDRFWDCQDGQWPFAYGDRVYDRDAGVYVARTGSW